MQDLQTMVLVHIRRQVAVRSQKLRAHRQNVDRPVKQGCQVEYRGIGARVMAQQRREEREAQMEAAANMFTDSRASLTPAELRGIYQDMSGNG